MERDEILKTVRAIEWPHPIVIHVIDADVTGDVVGFVSARAMHRDDYLDWEPVAVNVWEPSIAYKNGVVRSGLGASVPFERIISIEVP